MRDFPDIIEVAPFKYWAVGDNRLTKSDAVLYCRFLNTNDHNDWRLPSSGEIWFINQHTELLGDAGIEQYEDYHVHETQVWLTDDIDAELATVVKLNVIPIRNKNKVVAHST
jgi:hypothetical protein